MPTDYLTTDSAIPLKRCTKCKQDQPKTREYFGKYAASPDGFRPVCKACRRAEQAANPEPVRQRVQAWYKANTDRAKAYHAGYRAGEKTHTREEFLEDKHASYARNADGANARRRAKRVEDPTVLLQEKAWRAEHFAEVQGYRHARRVEHAINPERVRAADRERYAKNPARKRGETAQRLARQAALPSTLTNEQWWYCLQYWAYSCAYCGREEGFQWKLVADHFIPLSHPLCPGTVAENLVPACHGISGCNNEKLNYDALEWLTRKFGARQAKKKLRDVAAYFAFVRARHDA